MGEEIRKETDWFGSEIDVIYEDGTKVGETRHETTFFGNPIDRTYDNSGNRVSETRHETTLFGSSKEVTYDPHGNKVSETTYEEGIFGGKKGIIYQSGNKIGELKTEKGFFGGRKRILHKSSEDVDLTRRATKEKSTRSQRNDSRSDFEQTNFLQEEDGPGKKVQMSDRRFHVYKHTSPEAIKKALDSGQYLGVTFEPTIYSVRYKCDRCGHECDEIHDSHGGIPEFKKCRMGCSVGDDDSFFGLVKIILSLFTGKSPFGYGRLISQKELY